jgi:hypothetical protein
MVSRPLDEGPVRGAALTANPSPEATPRYTDPDREDRAHPHVSRRAARRVGGLVSRASHAVVVHIAWGAPAGGANPGRRPNPRGHPVRDVEAVIGSDHRRRHRRHGRSGGQLVSETEALRTSHRRSADVTVVSRADHTCHRVLGPQHVPSKARGVGRRGTPYGRRSRSIPSAQTGQPRRAAVATLRSRVATPQRMIRYPRDSSLRRSAIRNTCNSPLWLSCNSGADCQGTVLPIRAQNAHTESAARRTNIIAPSNNATTDVGSRWWRFSGL